MAIDPTIDFFILLPKKIRSLFGFFGQWTKKLDTNFLIVDVAIISWQPKIFKQPEFFENYLKSFSHLINNGHWFDN